MPSALPNAVRAVATVWLIAVHIGVQWVLLWLLQIIAIAFMYPFSTKVQRQSVCGYIHRGMNYIFIVLLNPMWSITNLRTCPKIPKGQPFMFMMNHVSNADPWLVIRAMYPYDSKWIAKGSLFSVPFGGWGMALAGDLAIKFTKEKGGWGTEKGSVGQLMRDSEAYVRAGQPLAVFPEGVRNPKPYDGMSDFKDGYFDLAIKTGAWIVPIANSGGEKAWPVRDWKFDACKIYITACDPIKPDGHTVESLKQAVRDKLDQTINSHPDRVAMNKKK